MLLCKEQIKEILPHRSPLLLVDEAELEENEASANFFVSPEMDIFKGHFPECPVLPGIYLTESMAQTADILILSMEGNRGKLPFFSSVNKMRFIRPVYPGNTIILKASVTADSGNGMYECSVSALVGGKKAAQGSLTIALK